MSITAIASTGATGDRGLADRLEPIDHAHALDAFATTVAHVAVCVLIAVAPFELTRPFVQLPHQSISNLEAIMAAAVLAWLGALAWSRRLPVWHTPITMPWLLLLAVMAVASALAPAAKFNAFHMAGRFAAAFVLCLLAFNATTTAARLRRTLMVALVSGTVVAVLAILESLRVPFVIEGLKAFRPDIFVVGAQLRAGGSLQYPTIASMYLEIIFAFGLGLLLVDIEERRRSAIGIGIALLLIAEAIILTFTRAGLIAVFASLAVVAWWSYRYTARQSGDRLAIRTLLAFAMLVIVQFVASRPAQNLWLRLTTEEQTGWYRSAITAPPEVSLAPDELRGIPIHITNTGRMGWDSTADPPFYLSYHWLDADARRVVSYDGVRTPFDHSITPGEAIDLVATVRAPNHPGRYRLAWDVVQEGQLWFSTEVGSVTTYSNAEISGPSASARPPHGPLLTTALPKHTDRPGRGVLWNAAARLLLAHPLFGVGPDNFRLMYGPAAGLKDADTRVHSNNMYIEVLVGAGLLGALAFAWLIWRLGVATARAVRMPTAGRWSPPLLGVAAGIVAIALHGFVDCFVGFTPTYVTIALTLGLVLAGAGRADTGNHAHRV